MNVLSLLKNKQKRKLTRHEKFVLVIVLCAVLVGTTLPGRLIVSTSPSLNHRIFFIMSATHLKTGDTVVFRHKITEPKLIKKTLNPNKDQFIKKIGCASGQTLRRVDKMFYCESNWLVEVLAKDSKGDVLPQFKFAGVVPANNYFMVGDNPRSYDSRYFGYVHADEILYKALPIW